MFFIFINKSLFYRIMFFDIKSRKNVENYEIID
jgi:hypothetical protein